MTHYRRRTGVLAMVGRRLVLAGLLFTIGWGAPDAALAQSHRALREARSANRRYVLEIERTGRDAERHADSQPSDGDSAAETPDAPSPDSPPVDGEPAQDAPPSADAADNGAPERQSRGPGGCMGTLKQREREPRDVRVVWRARLVNEAAPVLAEIHNDGKYVITLDEYQFGGARHAVVAYDARGKLLREFTLKELLRGGDWREVKTRRRAVEWLAGARFKFDESPDRFVIRLRWGRQIEINLEDLSVRTIRRDNESDDASEIPPEIEAALRGEAVGDGQPGEVGFELEEFEAVHNRILELEKLLAAGGDDPQLLAELAAEREKLMALLSQIPEVEPSVAELMTQAQAAMAAGMEPDASEAVRTALEAAVADARAAEAAKSFDDVSAAGVSAMAGVPVPKPNPAEPVNYLDWVRSHVEGGDPSAQMMYQQAIDSLVKFEGDADLRDRALKGDPEALASPEIQAWVSANAEAMKLAWEADDLDYRGMPIQTSDDSGTLISVLLPALGNFRDITRAAVIQGRTLESQGSVAEAREQYMNALKFGSQAGHGWTLIENLVGIAMQNPSSSALLDSFEHDDGTDYAELANRLESAYRPVRPVTETLQFERAMMLDLVQRSYEYDAEAGTYRVSEPGLKTLTEAMAMGGQPDNPNGELGLGVFLGGIGFERMSATANEWYDRMTVASQSPFPQARQQFGEIESDLQAPGLKMQNPLIHAMIPALGRANESATRAESQRRATLLVANLKAYRQQTGQYPPSLDVFAERDFATDPFTGQPYRYVPSDSDFALYSIGADGVDDGGAHAQDGKQLDTRFWPRPK